MDTPASSSDSSQQPRMRAGNVLREKANKMLLAAFEEGQLDYAELQERTDIATRATYQDEIFTLFADIDTQALPPHLRSLSSSTTDPSALTNPPGTPQSQPRTGEAIASNAFGTVSGERGDFGAGTAPVRYGSPRTGRNASLAIFGGSDLRHWICAPSHTSIAAFGGTTLDFRTATLTSPHTTINVGCAFGGIDIIVPENYRIIVNILPIFGGCEVKDKPGVSLNPATLPDSAPTIVVQGLVAFGGVDVLRAPAR